MIHRIGNDIRMARANFFLRVVGRLFYVIRGNKLGL